MGQAAAGSSGEVTQKHMRAGCHVCGGLLLGGGCIAAHLGQDARLCVVAGCAGQHLGDDIVCA